MHFDKHPEIDPVAADREAHRPRCILCAIPCDLGVCDPCMARVEAAEPQMDPGARQVPSVDTLLDAEFGQEVSRGR